MEKIAVGAKVPIAWTVAGMSLHHERERREEERREEGMRGEGRRGEGRGGDERGGGEERDGKISRWSQGPHCLDCCGYAFFFVSCERKRRGEERRGDKRGEKRREEERRGEEREMGKIAVGAKVPIAWTVAGMLFVLCCERKRRGEKRRGGARRGEKRGEEGRRGERRSGEIDRDGRG